MQDEKISTLNQIPIEGKVSDIISVMGTNKWLTVTQLSLKSKVDMEDIFFILFLGKDKIFSVYDGRWKRKKGVTPYTIDLVKRDAIRLKQSLYTRTGQDAKYKIALAYKASLSSLETLRAQKLSNKQNRRSHKRVAVKVFIHSAFGIGRHKSEEYKGPINQYWNDPNFKKIDPDA